MPDSCNLKSIYKPFNFLHAMNRMRNNVRLIGNVGQDPEIKNLENDRKMATVNLATTETYRNDKGEKVEETQWHRVVAWGEKADLIEKYVTKGKELALEGKLVHRTYEDKNNEKKYITEVVVNELLFI